MTLKNKLKAEILKNVDVSSIFTSPFDSLKPTAITIESPVPEPIIEILAVPPECAPCTGTFLRKDVSDSTAFAITIGGTFTANGFSYFNQQVVSNTLSHFYQSSSIVLDSTTLYVSDGSQIDLIDTFLQVLNSGVHKGGIGWNSSAGWSNVSAETADLGWDTTKGYVSIGVKDTNIYSNLLISDDRKSDATTTFNQLTNFFRDANFYDNNNDSGLFAVTSSNANNYFAETRQSDSYNRVTYGEKTFTYKSYTKELLALNSSIAKLTALTAEFVTLKTVNTSLAEYYTADKVYLPGTVLCYGGSAEVTDVSVVGDKRVAGVVVGVNDQTNPDFDFLDALDDLDGKFDYLAPIVDENSITEIKTFRTRLEALEDLKRLEDLTILDDLNNFPPLPEDIVQNPAILMNSNLVNTAPIVTAVALQGRVQCKVTGTIRKGDLLVADGKGGACAAHAEQMPGPNPYQGAVIGKAIQDNNDLHAMIDIIVWHA